MATLKKSTKFNGVEGPLLTIVMDGIGLAPDTVSNAVATSYTPTLDMLMAKYPTFSLKAHGTAVGLPSDDDMGNSEVGHNALGAGQVFAQGAKLVSNSIESGKMFESAAWKEIVSVKDTGKTLHFMSRGNNYGYFRYNDTDAVFVFVNASAEPVNVPWSTYAEIGESLKDGKDVITGEQVAITDETVVAPETALIVEFKR